MLYQIKGLNKEGFPRYVQYSSRTGDPIIQSRIGVSAYNTVVFKTEEEANSFLKAFKESKNRDDIDWKVCPLRVRYEWTLTYGDHYYDIESNAFISKNVKEHKFVVKAIENMTKYGLAYRRKSEEVYC